MNMNRGLVMGFLMIVWGKCLNLQNLLTKLLRMVHLAAAFSQSGTKMRTDYKHGAPAHGQRHIVICIGQSLLEGGQLPPALKLRVDHAAEVYKRLSAKEGRASLYVSGADVAGQGKFTPEGEVMFRLLLQHGIDAKDIDVDTKAWNTIENAQNAIKPIQIRGAEIATLVTSEFHSPRAAFLFKTVFAATAPNVIVKLDPAESGLERAAMRPVRQLPKEINDWNFSERIWHETRKMQNTMVPKLLKYGYQSRQSDVDEALAALRDAR